MRGIVNHIIAVRPPRERLSSILVIEKSYVCTTKRKKLERVLAVWGIKLPNFAYAFSLLEWSHRLCETTKDGFLLLMHALETRFDLPLYLFFCNLLDYYNINSGQLSCFSWWLIMTYFLNCSQRSEMKLLSSFKGFASVAYRFWKLSSQVIDDVGIDQGSDDTSSGTNKISRELNEVTDIDSSVNGALDTSLLIADSASNNDPELKYGDVYLLCRLNEWFLICLMLGSLTLVNCVGGCCSSPTSLNIKTGSFALTNCVGSCNSLLVSLSMTTRSFPLTNCVGSFTLANCVGGYDSLPTSFNMITGSLVLANCVGKCSPSPMIFSMAVGSFALTNCVRGCDFLCTSLNITTRSFVIANYVGGYGFSPTSLNMTAGSFGLINCVEGCSSSPSSLNMTTKSFALTNYVRGCGLRLQALI
ncbi:hypothetical protein J1N35_018596 [Gossypium stocksii]|uniref:Uncharacterized protein n=1 Tax=Gossypium stocksii TaxID=47602 RepID=A0A9D3VQ34_9ROSI|nr:hypothetical protein J1N35_018596 [Gossypium stocksii]